MIYNFDELSFQILTVDRFFHKDGFFKVKARPYAALSLRTKGTGRFKIGERSFLTKQGDVLFLPADTPYEVDYSVSESIVVHLKQCNYREAELFEGVSGVTSHFSLLREDWETLHSTLRAKAGIYSILEKIKSIKESSMESTAFFTVLDYVKMHFCDDVLDIATLCKIGFISPSSLRRMFLQYLGMPPKEYVVKLRMEKALRLLTENRLTVRQIAVACGFSDEKYFARAFKQKHGYPPSKLRDYIT